MTDPDTRTQRLIDARRKHAGEKIERVFEALRQLQSNGAAITFAGVARHAGVSTWLAYNNPALRQAITDARLAATQPAIPRPDQSATAQSLKTDLAHARAEVGRLRTENSSLLQAVGHRLGSELETASPHQLSEDLREARRHLAELADTVIMLREELRTTAAERDNTAAELLAARETLRRMMRDRNTST